MISNAWIIIIIFSSSATIPHRLNLFYVANDVIQNCKRKNAIIFRDAFSEVLLEAGALVRDLSIRKSVERIFTIWEQRSVYPQELIVELRDTLGETAVDTAVQLGQAVQSARGGRVERCGRQRKKLSFSSYGPGSLANCHLTLLGIQSKTK
uniref:CID domain-containing protein n=1 Tax=Callorhinchus milii TaxID=7868 RepID=A0A4W3GAJ0_CALMI